MSVRSFHSVFMATAVAGAALGCYLVSLRVASERAALEEVETEIVLAQRDIRLLQTEIGTRARLAQLERWNVRVLSLSAPTADQILGDKFQLARLIKPERKPAIDAPVILATASAPPPQQPLMQEAVPDSSTGAPGQLLHEASVTIAPATAEPKQRPSVVPPKKRPDAVPPKSMIATATPPKAPPASARTGDREPKGKTAAATQTVRTARADPLAPLPAAPTTDKAARTDR